MLNRRERPTLDATLEREHQPLTLERVLRLMHTGAQVIDVREPADFAGAHLAGSLNISLVGSYATWAGTLLDPKKPVVLVAEPGTEQEAAMRLGRIGFDNVEGYLDGGMQALESRPDLVQRIERITAPTLAERLAEADSPMILDVRTEREWQDKHIEGSVNIALQHLQERLSEVPSDRPVVIHCATGYRSSIAASLLEKHGMSRVADLVGGFAAWEASQLETVGSAGTEA
jgi:rhodanese-related sulfurtransferase